MNIIKDFINSHGNELTSKLIGQGFTNDQATKFIPEASNSIVDTVKHLDFSNLIEKGSDAQVSSLLNQVDIGALASKLGLDAGMVTNGLQSLIPELLNFMKEHGGHASGLMSFIHGGKSGGFSGFVKGLFHR